jgi:hypothetical protein
MGWQPILISLAILHEQWIVAAIVATHFRPGVPIQIVLLHCRKKSRRAVNAIAVQQRHSGHVQLRGGIGVFFRQRCATQETECGAGVKFDEGNQS